MGKIYEKYKKMSEPVKASLWFVISNVLLRGISFVTLPIFSRLMSTSEYGVVSVYNSWVLILSIITTLTIWGGVFSVALVKNEKERDKIISTFQGLAVSISFLFFLVSVIFIKYVKAWLGMSKFLVICMYIEIIVQIPYNLWAAKQRYDFKYKAIVFISLLIAIGNPILGVVAVLNAKNKAEARIVSSLLIQVVIGLIIFVINQNKGKRYYDRKLWKYAFCFNIVLVPHYLSMQVLNQADRVMIQKMCGEDKAGIYSVAYSFAMLLQLITSGVNSSLTPHIYESIKNNESSKIGKTVNYASLAIAVSAIMLMCVTPDIFMLLLPSSYYEAMWVIPPVTAGAFFLFLYPLFGAIEFYYDENKFVTIASIVGAIVNIVMNYICINIFGFIAAAYTTLICYILFCVCHYKFMKKTLKKRGIDIKIYDIKSLFAISVSVISISLILVRLYNYYLIRWLVILFCISLLLLKIKSIKQIIRR